MSKLLNAVQAEHHQASATSSRQGRSRNAAAASATARGSFAAPLSEAHPSSAVSTAAGAVYGVAKSPAAAVVAELRVEASSVGHQETLARGEWTQGRYELAAKGKINGRLTGSVTGDSPHRSSESGTQAG